MGNQPANRSSHLEWGDIKHEASGRRQCRMASISQPADTVDLNLGWSPTTGKPMELEDREWSPPDLSPRSPWHKAQVEQLYAVTQDMANRERHWEDGLWALEIH